MKEALKGVWADFLIGFCKVSNVCYQGQPNWLGYIAIGIGGVMALGIGASLLGAALGAAGAVVFAGFFHLFRGIQFALRLLHRLVVRKV